MLCSGILRFPVGFIHFAAQTYDPDMLRLFDTMAAERTDRYKWPAVFGGFRGPLGRSYKRVEVTVDPALLACPSQLGLRKNCVAANRRVVDPSATLKRHLLRLHHRLCC